MQCGAGPSGSWIDLVSQSVWDAITKYLILGNLETKEMYYSQLGGGGKSKVRVLAYSVPGEGLFLIERVLKLCPHTVEETKSSLKPLL